MDQEKKGPQYTEVDEDFVFESKPRESEFDTYKMLPAEEAIQAHVFDIKPGKKVYQGEESERVYIWFEVDEGEGKGQRYRDDMSPILTQGKGKRNSNFDEFMFKLTGEYPAKIRKGDVIGLPIRIELTEPKEYSGRSMQFVSAYKKPLASQKRVEVTHEQPATESLPDSPISPDEVNGMFEQA